MTGLSTTESSSSWSFQHCVSNSRSKSRWHRGKYLIILLVVMLSCWTVWLPSTIKQLPSQQMIDMLNRPASDANIENMINHKKTRSLPRVSIETLPPRNSSAETAGFVHIGKTGGSTLSRLLRNGCNSLLQSSGTSDGACPRPKEIVETKESQVSRLVEHYYHVPDFWRLPQSNHGTFVVTIRDPFDRTVSALLYQHPENAKYYNSQQSKRQKAAGQLAYQCFPTLEDFATLLQHGNETDCYYPYRHNVIEPKDCVEMACAAIHGKIRFFSHLFFNYRNILYTKLPLKKAAVWEEQQSRQGNNRVGRELYVIRQEHLWEDWKRLNRLLSPDKNGEESSFRRPTSDQPRVISRRNITGLHLPVTKDLSERGRQKLCKALEPEYYAYFQLLHLAKNMGERDLRDCEKVAIENCPKSEVAAIFTTIHGNGREFHDLL